MTSRRRIQPEISAADDHAVSATIGSHQPCVLRYHHSRHWVAFLVTWQWWLNHGEHGRLRFTTSLVGTCLSMRVRIVKLYKLKKADMGVSVQLERQNVSPESINVQFLPQSFRSSHLLHAWLCICANLELRRYQQVIGEHGQINMNHVSCSMLRDDNIQHLTRTMCRTDGVLDQVSTIKNVLGIDCRWCGLILEMQVYIADNYNWGHVDCQMLNKFDKVVKEDLFGRLWSWSVHDDKHEVHRRALYLNSHLLHGRKRWQL